MKSCLKCARYVRCLDENKGVGYSCKKFQKITISRLEDVEHFEIDLGGDFVDTSEQEKNIEVANRTYGEDFDIMSLMESAIDPLTGKLRDLKIDDRDFKLADSYFDFSINMCAARPPFARQMWISYKLLGEWCPSCSDPAWEKIKNVPVDFPTKDIPEHVQFLVHGVCPKCKTTKRDHIKSGRIKPFQQGILCLGQRSGKSTMISSLGAYQTHRMLKIPKLSSLTQYIQSFSPLTATFVALNFGKAKTLLYDPWKNFISETNWFQEYFKMLDHYGNQYGQEFYKVLNEAAVFNHKNLRIYPSSPNKDTLRGDTRWMAGIDELGLFALAQSRDEIEEEGERKLANADETHTSLLNSLVTVQNAMEDLVMKQKMYHLPFAMLFNISSPKHEKDKMMRLLKEAKGSKSMFGVNLATWKVNPGMPRSSPMIVERYRTDPIAAERDFGAKPPATTSNYLTASLLKNDVFVGARNAHRIEYDNTSEFTKAKAILNRAVPFPSVTAIDAGLVNNSFAAGSGYYDFKEGKIVISCLVEAIPVSKRPIDFNYMYRNVIVPLVNDTNSIMLIADRWNSVDLLHRIPEDVKPGWEIKSKQYTLKRRDFVNQLTMFQNKNIILPPTERPMDTIPSIENYRELKHEPISHYYLQCLTVKDTGNTLTKGDNYTDDLFRVVTLLVTALTNERVLDRLRKTKITSNNGRSPLPIYFSRSGGTALRNIDQSKLVVLSRKNYLG